MELPEMMAPERGRLTESHIDTVISLAGRDYNKAKAIPGAIYSSAHGGMVLPVVTPRAAIVALTIFPDLGNEYPELVETRAQLMQDASPTDYATPLGIAIDAPIVHQSLLDAGHDWLTFDAPLHGSQDRWPNQSTDLGYAAAVLQRHGAFYLGWSRGYGKTLGTCAIIEANRYDRVLISVPNTAKQDVWLRELEARGIAQSHEIFVMPNDKAKRERLLDRIKAGDMPACYVFVVHHESVALVAKWGPPSTAKVLGGWKRLGVEWDLHVTDEAHRLKSAGRNGSQFHKASCKVPSWHRLALSGSVYENSWEEVYGPLHWLLPTRYSSQWESWNLRHFDYIHSGYGKVCVGILPDHEQALRDEIGVFMIVREKPIKAQEHRHFVDLSTAQRAAYTELQRDFATQLEDGTTIVADSGIVMLGKLRQIATGLNLVSKTITDSSKLDAAMQVISDYEDFDDFFVACWYRESAYALADRLDDAGYTTVGVITGDVPQKQRGQIIQHTRTIVNDHLGERLQPTILIGTIATLGESANLQHLNHVIRIDRSFNPALNRQVVDRCDRTGQTREVRLTDIIARDTVDELVVMPNLANKDAFRALVLGRAA